jgi:hypothetical protein
MKTAEPFYLYRVVDAEGNMTHSSVLYPGADSLPPTPEQLREHLLTSVSYAVEEFQFPDRDDAVKDVTLELHGPFFSTVPTASITHAEHVAIPEEDLP